MQVDVGFGDAVTPPPTLERIPPLLDLDPPVLLTYRRETVVAEKLEAMISLGVTTSRMKDFYDVYLLAASFEFDGGTLVRAIQDTFKCRKTPIPGPDPLVLQAEFLASPERRGPWRALLRRSRLDGPTDTEELSSLLRRFLVPLLLAADGSEAVPKSWPPGGPWQTEEMRESESG